LANGNSSNVELTSNDKKKEAEEVRERKERKKERTFFLTIFPFDLAEGRR
jgi:hypothetical protein